LTRWFEKHRSKLKLKAGTGNSFIVNSTRHSEADFALFFDENPHPPDELVDVWARTLKVPVTLVHDWIARKREKEGIGRLLTPRTTSPEIKLEEESASAGLDTTSIVPDVPSSPKRKKKPTHRIRLLRAIGEGMDRVDAAPPQSTVASEEWLPLSPVSPSPMPSSSALPTSADEFNTRFAPYEIQMRSFLEKVGRGELEEKGWKAGWGFG
ncbi:hypothetical protein BDZ89DRAFT_1141518, partial [Hymenopellis radicata]